MHLSNFKWKLGTGIIGVTFTVMVAQEPNEHAMDHGQHPMFEPVVQISQDIAPITTTATLNVRVIEPIGVSEEFQITHMIL